ncbi:amino acid transporter aATP11 [Strigomonas culicis]|uniref:Amino acid transporter aATP11 n=1 Tax=Strigomonas culicis TaxID=28005 RepID=S9TXF0_9TRYP|nr:amino acid transporter aATP11 [Strigomonas culicis]|eukprot:EPY23147.1 amino acid transporter aATP11 [Strigomonas culicis]
MTDNQNRHRGDAWIYEDDDKRPAYRQQEEVAAEIVTDLKEGAADDSANLAQRRIDDMDQERAEWVARRRTPTNALQKYVNYILPYGGILSSGLNLASSSIGAGIIALPSAFEASGIIMSVIYLVVIAFLTVYSFTLIGIAGQKTGLRNYEQIVRALMGNGADYWLAFCLWLLSFGAEVSYAISLKNVVTQFLDNGAGVPDYLRTIAGQRLITSMIWLVVMLPLCLPKEINSLRYFSFLAILFIIFFVICMIVHASENGLKDGMRSDLVLFQTGNKAIGGLAIFIFAFICQLNALEVYNELYRPSVLRLTLSAGVGVFLCFTLYFIAGFVGYADFGPSVASLSSLQMYNPIENPLMGVSYVGIMLKLCVGYGLHMIPVRDAIYHVVGWEVHTLAWWKHACVCTSMAALSLICGLFIPRINLVFGLVGGFSGGFIGFVYPAFMYMYSGNWTFGSVGWFHYLSTYVLLLVGIIAIVWGTADTIYGAIGSSS